MLTATTDTLPGKRIVEVLGIARGNTVRARHVGSNLVAGLKSVVGGEIRSYTDLLDGAREEALDRMKDHARHLGAHAVVGVRFVTSEVSDGFAELLAYGTAVRLQNDAT